MKRKLHLTDTLLIILLGITVIFVSFIPAYAEKYMPLAFNSTLYSVFFLAMISTLCTYLFYEVKYNKLKVNKFFALVFLILIVENIIVTLCQPNYEIINAVCKNSHDVSNDPRMIEIFTRSGIIPPSEVFEGQTYSLFVDLEPEYKWFGITALVGQLLVIYLVMFVLPKKLPSQKILYYLGFIAVAIGGISIIYSLIFEASKYAELIKNLFNGAGFELASPIQSFTGQHNVYGMLLLIVMFFMMIYHSLKPKWWLWLLIFFFYLNVVISMSKGSIVTGAIMIFGFIVTRLSITRKQNVERNTTALILIGIFFVGAVGATIISVITQGQVLSFIYDALMKIPNSPTIVTRVRIWENTAQLLNSYNGWIFGRGFNIFLRMLYPMNTLNGDPVIVPHNGVLRLLCFGGIPMLIAFTLLVIWCIKITIKRFKVNPSISLTCLISAFAFVIYSIIETNHIIIIAMFLPILFIDAEKELEEKPIQYELPYKEEIKENSRNSLSQTVSYFGLIICTVISGIFYPIISKFGLIMLILPVILYLVYALITLLCGAIDAYKHKEKFNLLNCLYDNRFNLLITLLLCALTIGMMAVFKEVDFGRGLFFGLGVYLLSLSVYLLVKPLRDQTGNIRKWSVKFDKTLDKGVNKVL